MKKVIALAIVMIMASAAGDALAVPIGPQAFSGDAVLIDFETIMPFTPITTQFSGLGVSISGGLFGDPFPASTIQGNREATNFLFAALVRNPIIVTFTQQQVRVGFLFAGDDSGESTLLLRAISGGSLVDQSAFTIGSILPGGNLPAGFAGLEVPQGFDMIEISRVDGNGAFSIDDFRFQSAQPIPEPATMLLLGTGLAGVAAKVRNRRKANKGEEV